MAIGIRLAAMASVILLAQRCQGADDPVSALPNEERLRRVIKETVNQKSASHRPLPADVQALLVWSQPVTGLAARIESVWGKDILLVRLKNLSGRPLEVSTGNPADPNAAPLFEVFVQQGSSAWRRITAASRYANYYSAPEEGDTERPRVIGRATIRARGPSDRPWMTLQPGEDGIAIVSGQDQEGTGEPTQVKVILRQSDANIRERWNGVLETPPRPLELSQEQHQALREALPFPNHCPAFSYQFGGVVVGEPPDRAGVELLHHSNLPLTETLAIYEPAGVCREFERRMLAEKILPMKLLFAGIAAPAGSQSAAMFFVDLMKRTDYATWTNLSNVVWFMSRAYRAWPPQSERHEPPNWLTEMMLDISSDNRPVTGLTEAGWADGTSFTIASRFGMVSTLVEWKCRKVVPLLNERVKNGTADCQTWHALAQFGDARAISGLIELLKRLGNEGRLTRQEDPGDSFERCAYILAELKARDAVPVLLTHVELPDIIGDLAEIGDDRALPALRDLVAGKGQIVRDGRRIDREQENERLFAARLALARFDQENEAAQLAQMLVDANRHHRYDVVFRLARLPDPRAIPILVKVIKTDSDHYVLDMAIGALGERKHKGAVEGLIGCFEVAFKEGDLGKGEHVTPATYQNRIARSLQHITGQQFGADQQRWLKWWQDEGRLRADLK